LFKPLFTIYYDLMQVAGMQANPSLSSHCSLHATTLQVLYYESSSTSVGKSSYVIYYYYCSSGFQSSNDQRSTRTELDTLACQETNLFHVNRHVQRFSPKLWSLNIEGSTSTSYFLLLPELERCH
jgi:hypothetical protein